MFVIWKIYMLGGREGETVSANFTGLLHPRVFHPWGKIFKGEIEIWRVKIQIPRVTTFNTIFPSPLLSPQSEASFSIDILNLDKQTVTFTD